eukprot:TRINITY_DN93556_c0_g1_i2.p1 TRINITY_DN93556_c0_g1~~TRINITY_DN93556_c0_g1_i2.p1  ORF type:complete len:234 (+),score=23.27 TRINITY_DN93556_c0_g1_i2:54-755(+)
MTSSAFRDFASRKKQRFLDQLRAVVNFTNGEIAKPPLLHLQLVRAQEGARPKTPYGQLEACWCILVEGATANTVCRVDAEEHFKWQQWNNAGTHLQARNLTSEDVPMVVIEFVHHFIKHLEAEMGKSESPVLGNLVDGDADETKTFCSMPGPLPAPPGIAIADSKVMEDDILQFQGVLDVVQRAPPSTLQMAPRGTFCLPTSTNTKARAQHTPCACRNYRNSTGLYNISNNAK